MKINLPKNKFVYSLSKLLLLAFAILLAQGCSKEDLDKLTGGSFGPDFAVPVINSKLFLKDFLKKDTTGAIKEDANKYLTIVYSGIPFTQSANEIMRLDSQTAKFSKGLPKGMPGGIAAPFKISVRDSTNDTTQMTNSDGVEVEVLKIKKGTLILTLSSEFKFSGEITLTLPSLTRPNFLL